MIKKLLLFTFGFLSALSSGAQGEADKWYFGTLAGIDFTGGAPVAISGSLNSSEGTAAISSPAGALMFYTDGVTVWDSTDTPMPNGSGLMGDVSTTQSAIIVPSLSSSSQYYLFTLAADGGPAGFRYSIVDMTLNGGLGDVTAAKNVPLTDSVTEKLCAIRDADGSGYWIMVHKWGNNDFYAYHLTASGLSSPVISSVGAVHTANVIDIQNTYGQMKFNMCGDKLALAMGYLDMGELFDFNNGNGTVSNPVTFSFTHHTYGVEFSKNSNILYFTTYDPAAPIIQYNIALGTPALIVASKFVIGSSNSAYALQIGPDGKIYVAQSFGSPFLGAVNNPDLYGTAANFNENAILLDPMGNGVMGGPGLPSFMQNYLKINVTCTVGLDEASNEEAAVVFPNPASNEFNIDLGAANGNITVYDHTGKLIERQSNASRFVFGKEYSSGMYFVSCETAGKLKTYKIIKN